MKHLLTFATCACALTCFAESPALGLTNNPRAQSYAIVIEAETKADPAWTKVVEALQAKHPGAVVVEWTGNVEASQAALSKAMPRYIAFVSRPEKTTRTFVCDIHRLTRRLDGDPYIDAQWGIITGATAELATATVAGPTSLTVQNALNTTGINDGILSRSLTISDGAKGTWREKQADGKTVEHAKLDRPAASIWADFFNEVKPDLMVTSSHGFQHGFETPFGSGFLLAHKGTLLPLDKPNGKPIGEALPESPNPKVYFPVGNCLVGHCDGPKSLVCVMMGKLGVRQMAGYTVVTWFGRGGWDMLSTWQSLPGRNNFSESFFINQVRLVEDLNKLCPDAGKFSPQFPNDGNPEPEMLLTQLSQANVWKSSKITNPRSKEGQEAVKQILGLTWDRDTVAFYGDPAFDARFAAAKNPEVTTELQRTGTRTHRLTVHFANAAAAAKGAPDVAVLFTQRITNGQLTKPTATNTVLADDFILVRSPKCTDGNKDLVIDFEGDVLP